MRTSRVFDASWPILHPDRPLSDLVAEALDLFTEMADAQRVRLLGDPVWSVVDNRMRVQAPAGRVARPKPAVEPVTYRGSQQGKVQAHIDDIRAWAVGGHLTDEAISERLKELHGITCDRTAVYKARRRNSIPAGRGNPTLAGYVPERLAGAVAA